MRLSKIRFDLAWWVLRHNTGQLHLLWKLYKTFNPAGYLVLESAILWVSKELRDRPYVEIHYPETYHSTGIMRTCLMRGHSGLGKLFGFQEIHNLSYFAKKRR